LHHLSFCFPCLVSCRGIYMISLPTPAISLAQFTALLRAKTSYLNLYSYWYSLIDPFEPSFLVTVRSSFCLLLACFRLGVLSLED
jgi:hypothetical protein